MDDSSNLNREKIRKKVRDKKLFLFDIDGTLFLSDTVIDGCRELLAEIKKQKKRSIFITNNSSKSTQEYVEKFKRAGIETNPEDFMTALNAAIIYLKKKFNGKKIYVLGTKALIDELRKNKINAVSSYEEGIDCALASFDTELTYEKIEEMCRVLRNEHTEFLATNPDLVCPVEGGFVPDCGSICIMLENAVKRKPVFIGKPNTLMIDLCLEETNNKKEDAVIVGDRLSTDILCGVRSGVDTIAVFTGETNQKEIDEWEYNPTFTYDSVMNIYEEILS